LKQDSASAAWQSYLALGKAFFVFLGVAANRIYPIPKSSGGLHPNIFSATQ